VSVELWHATLHFRAYDPSSGAVVRTNTPAFGFWGVASQLLDALGCASTPLDPALRLEPRRSRWQLRALSVTSLDTANVTIESLRGTASAVATLAVAEVTVRIVDRVASNGFVCAENTDKRRRRAGVAALKAKRYKIVAGVTSVLGARAALRGRMRDNKPKSIADFAALRFAADLDTPLKAEPLPLSTWGDEIRNLVAAPRSMLIKKVLLREASDGQTAWPARTAMFIIDFSTAPDELRHQRINERATVMLHRHAIDVNEIPVAVHGAALWISPGCGNLFDEEQAFVQSRDLQNKSNITEGGIDGQIHMDGAMLARVLMSQDADARSARKAIQAAVQAFRAIRIDRVSKAKMLWRNRARKRLMRLLPWLERTSRTVQGSGLLTANHQSTDIDQSILTLRAHAERTRPQGRANAFDAVISRIRYLRHLARR